MAELGQNINTLLGQSTEPFQADILGLPTQSVEQGTGVFLSGKNVLIRPARLKNNPTVRDPSLAPNDPRQVYTDCRTIDGWMDVLGRIVRAAWEKGNPNDPVIFTHDYAILPEDPKSLKGVIIVWEILSMIPAKFGSHSEIKPRVREVVQQVAQATAVDSAGNTVALPRSTTDGRTWIWAQSLDVVMKFSVYADSWKRKNEFVNKFLDLMVTYMGTFIQTGLQFCAFRGILQDALYDPPHNEEFPNQAILYDARIERQVKVHYAEIEEILIAAGLMNPLDGTMGDMLLEEVAGLQSSPVLPGQDG